MRLHTWGSIASSNFVKVFSNMVASAVVSRSLSWPYGSWFVPERIDPRTGWRNNQMGVGVGVGLWARDVKSDTDQQTVVTDFTTPATLDIDAVNPAPPDVLTALIVAASCENGLIGNGFVVRSSLLNPGEHGAVNFESSGGDAWRHPVHYPTIAVVPTNGLGNASNDSVMSGAGVVGGVPSRAINRAHGGTW